jgi:hypothetical protein
MIRASSSVNLKNVRKPAAIACMVLASKDPRDVFIVLVSRVWVDEVLIAITDTRSTELGYLLSESPESVAESCPAPRIEALVRTCVGRRSYSRLERSRRDKKSAVRYQHPPSCFKAISTAKS